MSALAFESSAMSEALPAARYKGVPGLRALYRAFPDAKWYIMFGALSAISYQKL